MSTTAVSAPRRIDVFDGLRGIAIILVVLSHGWTIWPSEYTLNHRPLSTLFASGNFAVSIFFVVGAFVATQGLLRLAESPGGLHPALTILRRYVRLTAPLAALLVVLVLVTVFDETDPYPDAETGASIERILTYSWNWYVRGHPFSARPDLGHLWYLSVDMQAFVLIAVLVWLLHRHRPWLLVILVAIFVGIEVWTLHVYPQEGYYQALLRTSVRIDAPLAGAIAAVALPYLLRLRPYATGLAATGLVALVPLSYYTTPAEGYFTTPGLLLDAALVLFVVGTTLGPEVRAIRLLVGNAALVALGRRSLSIFAWHYPCFYFSSRHNYEWDWWWRAGMVLGLTLVFVLLTEWLVERRTQRALQSPGWRELDYGFPAYVSRRWKLRRGQRAPVNAGDDARDRSGSTVG